MKRFAFVLLILVAMTAAWSAGFAQARVADFEIRIDAPTGAMRVFCSKGCDWSGSGLPDAMTYECDRQPCQLLFNGRGRIKVGMPVVPAIR